MEVSELPIYDEFMKVNKENSVVEVAKLFTKNPEIVSAFILDKDGVPEGIIVRDDVLRNVHHQGKCQDKHPRISREGGCPAKHQAFHSTS